MRHVTSSREKPLDLGNRVRGQLLRNLASYARDDLGVKRLAQIAQNFRRSDDHKLLEKIGVSMPIERFGKLAGKALLGKIVPIGLLHRTLGDTNTCIGSSRAIGALLTCRRVVTLQNLLDDQPDMSRVSFVAQKKCF